MVDKAKRLILVKGSCENCNKPVGVEVPEPDPIIEVVKEPCKCGISSESRAMKYAATGIATGVVAIILGFTSSCISNQYFTTQQIRAAKGEYKVMEDGKDYHKGAEPGPFFNTPDFKVAPVPKEEKK